VFVEDEKLKDKLQKDKPFVVIKLGDPLFKLDKPDGVDK
jgi:hypothetical protein